MSGFFRRTRTGSRENLRAGLMAGGMAAAVAVVSFYFARLFLAREPLEPLPSPAPEDGAAQDTEENGA